MYQFEIHQIKTHPYDIGSLNKIDIEFVENYKRILFEHFFQIVAKDDEKFEAVCQTCKLVKRLNLTSCCTCLVRHLKVRICFGNESKSLDCDIFRRIQFNFRFICVTFSTKQEKHDEAYTVYRDKILECGKRPTVCKSIAPKPNPTDLGAPSQSILFKQYFAIKSRNGSAVTAECKCCAGDVLVNGNIKSTSQFSKHLKVCIQLGQTTRIFRCAQFLEFVIF